MGFREATDTLIECGVTVAQIADAFGVSAGSILRARMQSGQRRSPPKGWEPVLHRMAWDRAREVRSEADADVAALSALAAELADA